MEINISQKKEETKIKAAAPLCSLGDIVEQLPVGTPLFPPVRVFFFNFNSIKSKTYVT